MPQSIVDQIESEFIGLGSRSAFRIDPSSLHPSLPAGRVGISTLRSILMHPSVSYGTQDIVIAELVRRAQGSQRDWITVVLGMLVPGIRPIVAKFTRNAPGERNDIEAEIIAGLIAAIRSFKLDNIRGTASRILWAGFRAGLAYRVNQTNASHVSLNHEVADTPDGHPDLVLADAVAAGVITTEQAWLIAETRLGELHLPAWATTCGVQQDTMRHRRAKAERTLRAWISGVGE